MSDSDKDEIRGMEMNRSEIDEFLTERGYGTFSVASEGQAYSVPISMGYDGKDLFMYLLTFGGKSRKLDYLQDTNRACFLAVEVNSRFDWGSVVVTGTTSEVGEDEENYHDEVLEDNGWFPNIFPPTDPMTDHTRIVLEPSKITGRKGGQYGD